MQSFEHRLVPLLLGTWLLEMRALLEPSPERPLDDTTWDALDVEPDPMEDECGKLVDESNELDVTAPPLEEECGKLVDESNEPDVTAPPLDEECCKLVEESNEPDVTAPPLEEECGKLVEESNELDVTPLLLEEMTSLLDCLLVALDDVCATLVEEVVVPQLDWTMDEVPKDEELALVPTPDELLAVVVLSRLHWLSDALHT